MKKLKRTLALLLAVCMMVTMIPTDVVASENTEQTEFEETEEETKEETEEETEEEAEEETKEEAEEETEEEAEEETEEEAEEETEEEAEEETEKKEEVKEANNTTSKKKVKLGAPINVDYSTETTAISVNSAKPENGQTSSQPFKSGTGGSSKFRIPALVTLSGEKYNGRLVAAADARWNHTQDAANIDTIVSWSDNNGADWKYTFANYIDDTSDTAAATDYKAATFIDPVLAADGDTVYMLVDLFPGQTAQNNCIAVANAGTGYGSNGLLLSMQGASGTATFNYYLNNGVIYDENGTDQGYTVDEFFNVSKNGEFKGNLFNYGETGFYPLQTSYLYLTKSTNGGETWSEPIMLNQQVKQSTETFYGVCPGRGLVTKDGRILFACYTYAGSESSQFASLIYSDDEGKTWTRTSNATSSNVWSSESQMIELENGSIRVFFRNGQKQVCYVDATPTDAGYTWGDIVKTGLYSCSNTMMSAVKYSEKINGKEAIIISYPASSSETGSASSNVSNRVKGKIAVGLVEDDGTMSWDYMYAVNNTYYWYSCLTELNDGSIGLLYETDSDGATIKYASYSITDLVGKDAVIGDSAGEDDGDNDDIEEANGIVISSNGDVSYSGNIANAVVGESVNSYVASKLEGKLSNYRAYDISVEGFVNGAAEVTVTLPIPEDVVDPAVYYVSDDGETVTDMNAVNNDDGTVSFVTDHFSTYAIGDRANNAEPAIVDVEVEVGKSVVEVLEGDDYSNQVDKSQLNESIALVDVKKEVIEGTESTEGGWFKTEAVDDGVEYILGNGERFITLGATGIGTVTNREDATKFTIEKSGEDGYFIKSGSTYLNYEFSWNNWSYNLTTAENEPSEWTWSNNANGINMYVMRTRYYLTYTGNGWSLVSDAGNYVNPYYYEEPSVGTEASVNTNVEITGVTVGETQVEVGNTTYYIVVKPLEKTLQVKIEDTVLTDVTGIVAANDISNFNNTNKNYVTVALSTDGKQLIFRGVSEGTVTRVLLGNTEYTINVVDVPVTVTKDNTPFVGGTGKYTEGDDFVTKVTLSEGMSYDINLKSTIGSNGTWSSLDTSVATVNSNGTITAKEAGTTYVSYSVDGGSYTIIVDVLEMYNPGNRVIDVRVDEVTNTDVYYGLDSSSNLRETQSGEVIYLGFSSYTSIIFFAAEKEGYALSYMSATGSADEYFSISKDVKNPNQFNKVGPVSTTQTVFGTEKTNAMLQAVIDRGCDGFSGMSRNNSTTGIATSMTFRSEKFPTISKKLNGVLGSSGKEVDFRRYAGEKMIAAVDEVVFFTIEILQDAPLTYSDADETVGSVSYKNAVLNEKLQGSYFYTKEDDDKDGTYDGKITNPVSVEDITNELNRAWSTEEKQAGYRRLEYYAAYIVKATDVHKEIIVNEVGFDYEYSSEYSSASHSAFGNALADIRVVGKYMDSIVVDYGLSVSIEDFTGEYLFDEIDLQKTLQANGFKNGELQRLIAAGSDGQVGTSDDVYTLIYTPGQIMTAAVPIVLYNADGQSINSFSVYPATSVYYEESFIDWDNNWSELGETIVDNQAYRKLGQNTAENNIFDPYGYDRNYAENGGASAGTHRKSINGGAKGTFSFKGTGLDVYANCTVDSGIVSFLVKNSSGKGVGIYMVDTAVADGITGTTSYEGKDYYHMAITTIKDLPYDTYSVTVMAGAKAKENPVYIDGIRVHGTIQDHKIYEIDLEDNPAYFELRDMVLNVLVVEHGVTGSLQYGSLQEMASQVYKKLAETDETPNAVITNNGTFDIKNDESGITAEQKVQDLLDNGPKNELFLYPGQALTFNVTTQRCMQIGLKAPTGTTAYTITDGQRTIADNKTLNSSVDMFYELNSKPTDLAKSYAITITNKGKNILSVTTLKICDDPNAYFNSLTAKDIEYTLAAMGYTFPEEENKAPESVVKPESTTKPGSSTTTEGTKSEAEDTKDSSSSSIPTEIVKVEVADSTKESSKVDQKETVSTSTDVKEETTESEEVVVESEITVEEDVELETETDIRESEISETTESEESNGNLIVMIGSAAILAAVIALIFGFKKSKKR